jgi:hypothetical protein
MIPGKDERLGLRQCNSQFKSKTLYEGKRHGNISRRASAFVWLKKS